MQLYVVHTCDGHYHTVPLQCHCYAVVRENAVLTMCCREQQRIDSLEPAETAYHVLFAMSGSQGHYDVTRLNDSERDAPNNRS